MSLIKCPECGRENVSDSAEMCPGCGFGIKKHFEAIKMKQEENEKCRIREEQERIELKSIPLPNKPEKPALFFMMSTLEKQKYYNALQLYELSRKDPLAYKKRILEAKKIAINAEVEKWLKRIKCPKCGSDDIKSISTLNRAISVSTVGLASNKIGKQYQCRKCKNIW